MMDTMATIDQGRAPQKPQQQVLTQGEVTGQLNQAEKPYQGERARFFQQLMIRKPPRVPRKDKKEVRRPRRRSEYEAACLQADTSGSFLQPHVRKQFISLSFFLFLFCLIDFFPWMNIEKRGTKTRITRLASSLSCHSSCFVHLCLVYLSIYPYSFYLSIFNEAIFYLFSIYPPTYP